MGQHQSRFSLSVGTKILISVVTLLLLVILFLNAITIKILFDDKRTYTLQAQSTEALLADRDFASSARRSLDTLKIVLGTLDPYRSIAAQQLQANRFNSVVQNQSEMLAVKFGVVDTLNGTLTQEAEYARSDALQKASLSEADLSIRPEVLQEVMPDLESNGYALFNLSSVGSTPLLGVAVADLEYRNRKEGLPIAVGYISLKGFGNDLHASDLVISDLDGAVLFATNPALFFAGKSVAEDPLFEAAVGSPIATGSKEYLFKGGHYLGSFVRSGLQFVVMTRTEWRRAMSAAYSLMEKFILLGCMAIGAAIIFAILFSKTMTAPINRLYQATREVGAGNFNLDLHSESSDEIGALTESFVSMSHQIRGLIEEKVEKVHLENELAIASTVQQTLIPPSSFANSLIEIQSHYQSASECGGDWWGFFGVGPKLCLMIADATGHGLPSALITASARSCFSVMHKLAQEVPEFGFSPGSMLAYANRVVHDAASGQIMMTFFVGVIDFEEGNIVYASAGHNPPWILKKQGESASLKSLTAVGQRLGESRDVEPFEEKTMPLNVGDSIFLYTDGLMEGKNLEGEMFGKKRVKRIVEQSVLAGPKEVIEKLTQDFLEFNSGKSLDDDVTIAVARILKIGGGEKA